MDTFRVLTVNGGVVTEDVDFHFWLPPGGSGYADAQIDDYGDSGGRRGFVWRPGVSMRLKARFSHEPGELLGTAGFGFWNAPFADPSMKWPTLPQAVWFFYASPPSDLPLPLEGVGQGWFMGTIDAGTKKAVSTIPFAPIFLLLNRSRSFRLRYWPMVRSRLGISFKPVPVTMTEWHHYRLDWRSDGCLFYVDEELVYQTAFSPRGPLGFVCWLDNQYMVLTRNGRFRWGTMPLAEAQWLEVADLQIASIATS
ncbi:MAG: hypothetical protein IAF02_21330 [Anaerolineae bacterium]|nr:hypothetical protein [Anaerolineae bacterium]